MFKRIQQLKIAELKQQIAKIRNQQHILNNPVDELQDQIYALENLIKRGSSAYQGKQKFNFWEKHFTQRDSYQKYQDWLNRYQSLPSQIAKLKERIKVQKQVIDMEQESLQRGIDILSYEISKIEQATSLTELGVEPQVAPEMLKEQTVTQQHQTASAQNPANIFFIDSQKLFALVEQIRNMGFNESAHFFINMRPQLEKYVLVDGKNHNLNCDVAQIEAFETQIYRALGMRPVKIKHTLKGFNHTNTAKDVAERILLNAFIQSSNTIVKEEPRQKEELNKAKPEERTL